MKKWVIISVLLHLCLLILVYRVTQRTHQWTKYGEVYQVELISLPANTGLEEKPTPKAETHRTTGEDRIQEKGPRLSVQGEPFPFNYYLDMLRKRIQENWQPPFQESGGAPMSAIVAFRIQKSGMIDQVELEKSTGRFMFDQAARRAVFDVGKMPPLPPEFSGGHITVHVEFETLWEKH
jgi:TonB family protein